MDTVSKAKRRRIMSAIKSSGTGPERSAAKIISDLGLRSLKQGAEALGRPDFYSASLRLAVFIDGCFWHGCPRHYKAPKTNKDFWNGKRARSMRRDAEVNKGLREKEIAVVRVCATDLKSARGPDLLKVRIVKALLREAGKTLRRAR